MTQRYLAMLLAAAGIAATAFWAYEWWALWRDRRRFQKLCQEQELETLRRSIRETYRDLWLRLEQRGPHE